MNRSRSRKMNDVSIVLCGEAGQGIQTVEHFLTRVFKLSGFNVFATKEYMSRIRGGANSTEIRISGKPVRAFTDRIDILVALSRGAVRHLENRISTRTVILGDGTVPGDDVGRAKASFVDIPLMKMADKAGGQIYATTIAAGAVSALFRVELAVLENYLKERFAAKGKNVVEKNIEAVRQGFQFGLSVLESGRIDISTGRSAGAADDLLLNGAEAVGLGAIAGGCNFISSYPMSPSTAVLVFLARHAGEFGIIAEQAEDEIAAMNMAVGAWYAGGRGMVTTSGGGFALMAEGLSLAGMLESPMVIHLAQRPGPATGLPTRTEQGDLLFALHAGHGEFPRIILAPGDVEEAFYLTRQAFDLAGRFQVPVFIITDQHLMDTYYNVPELDVPDRPPKNHIVRTGSNYKRYRIAADGLSPRGVPGYGEGLVIVDSDEHDEEGHITEDLDLRVRMVDKRLKKLDLVKGDIIPPLLFGKRDCRTLVIGWGSTFNAIKEAVDSLGMEGLSFLHYRQVYPLHPSTAGYIRKAKRTIIVENNAAGQFEQLIRLQTRFEESQKILKYSGMPFSVDELADRIKAAAR